LQSAFDEQAAAPSDAPASIGQVMFAMSTSQLPPLHVAKTLQP